ncbi:hypothetical protein [Patulibacter sp.]|uniref:hypothetical protein n=1 Tax=Patulibacter sp. TaxID=1912859 RepID=UPI002728FE67|nr:hypothetical protein [Patulibacter sp.]MDO9407896.1 hypothetical protein [Patulibacter sp.]
MRIPPLAIALSAAAALGATAAVATAQDVPPFEPEPTTPTTTVPTPAPPADASAPVVAVRLPKTRVGKRITSIRITMKDPDSSVAYSQVDVKRRIRLASGVRDQAYDGRVWRTTKSATKYRIYPEVEGRSVAYVLKLKKGLPAARYWITVKAQNEAGTSRTKKVSFRTR